MKFIENMKFAITLMVALCLLCAVVAFFLPNAYGMVLSYLSIALASVVAVLCVIGMVMLMNHRNAAA